MDFVRVNEKVDMVFTIHFGNKSPISTNFFKTLQIGHIWESISTNNSVRW